MIRIVGVLLVAVLLAVGFRPSPPAVAQTSVPAGLGLAKRLCGSCHAVGKGPSPLPDAPPFASLHHRYAPGCLRSVLAEGMLAPQRSPEEGGPRRHPRMPMATLDDDERDSLTTYLRGLDPRPDPPSPRCAPSLPLS
ncbi:cytochrome c [Caulobacter sp. 1776]|uniref:c-type cytochrome n=1 Tax=Caulobacter sp. 1776 TaxID=3156420 RepID=UPI003390931A